MTEPVSSREIRVVVCRTPDSLDLPYPKYMTSGAAGVAGVMVLIAVGNGLGSGIVMTLGADTAPVRGRSQFLGAWRLCGDVGNSGGPLLVSAVASVAPLATACVVIGVLGLVGTCWVGYWTADLERRRTSAISR